MKSNVANKKASATTAQLLTDKGLRPTQHRVCIAAKVLKKHNHFTADDICNWVEESDLRLSRATVYNILNELVAVGLLKSFHLNNVGRTIYDSNVGHHHHFYDRESGKVHDIHPEQLKVDLSQLEGFKVEEVSLVVTGRKI